MTTFAEMKLTKRNKLD